MQKTTSVEIVGLSQIEIERFNARLGRKAKSLLFTMTNVATGADVLRRQLSQWQCATKRGGAVTSNAMVRQKQRPVIRSIPVPP